MAKKLHDHEPPEGYGLAQSEEERHAEWHANGRDHTHSPHRGGHNIQPFAPAGDATHIGSENRPGGGFPELWGPEGEYTPTPLPPVDEGRP